VRRTNHWLVCDRNPLHQFGPAQTVTDLLMRARMAGWRVGVEGADVCSVCDRVPVEAMGESA